MLDFICESSGETILCSLCCNSILKGQRPPSAFTNNLDAGEVPSSLRCLSTIERRLICQIQTYMTMVVLPGGQYAEKGLAIHFPLDMATYLQQLNANANSEYVIVSEPNRNAPHVVGMQNLVNMPKVKHALTWLQQHNPLYRNFNIEFEFHNVPNISENECVRSQVSNILLQKKMTMNICIYF